MNVPDERYKWYLYDLGFLIKEYALDAKKRFVESKGTEKEMYEAGERMAFYSVVTLMQQQAEGFGIPLSDLRLDDINPDRDLL